MEDKVKKANIFNNSYALVLKIAICSLAITMLLSASSASANQINNDLDVEKLDAFYEGQITANNLKGMAVVIVNKDQVIYQQGFGMAGKESSFTPQTPFPISSGSKSFLALSVMQLVEEGKIQLDSPIQVYLPWWQVADAQLSAQITVRDLLNMVTGLVAGPGFYDDPSTSNRLPAETSLQDAVRDLEFAHARLPLRTGFLYFDGNYWTLAVLVEKISGQAYPQYLKEKIFDPLRMENTTTTAALPSGMAQGNLTFFGFPLTYPEIIDHKYLVGCCGVITTIEDMGHYLIAQLNDGQYGGTRLVSQESMQLMHTPRSDVTDFMGEQYAMGWMVEEVNGIKQLQDPGPWATYTSEMILLPEQGYGIAIFYNQGCWAPAITGFTAIRDDTIRLLTGSEPEGGITLKVYGLILGFLALLTIGLAIFSLARIPRWAMKVTRMPAWRKIFDTGLPLLEAGLLAIGFPLLVAYMTAKTFTLKIALLWWTDLASLLLMLSILLVIKAAMRSWILFRLSRNLRGTEERI